MDSATDPPEHPMFRLYGNELKKVKIAWLVSGNNVGFEIFQFIDPPTKSAEELRDEFKLSNQYQRGGLFHIGVTIPDPDALAKVLCEDGAVQVGETLQMWDGETALYLRDPWGMIVELMSGGYEQVMANRD